jgi:hypothetical protein
MICPYLCLAPDSPSSPHDLMICPYLCLAGYAVIRSGDDEAMEATMAMLLAAISCV